MDSCSRKPELAAARLLEPTRFLFVCIYNLAKNLPLQANHADSNSTSGMQQQFNNNQGYKRRIPLLIQRYMAA